MLRLRTFVALGFIVAVIATASSARAQTPEQQNLVFLPLITRAPTSAAGTWHGVLTQPGRIFDFTLVLDQEDTRLHGTATIQFEGTYATMSIDGTIFGETIVLDEAAITDTNGVPPGAGRWCMKTLTLSPGPTGYGNVLQGSWKQDGCNAGKVYLQDTATAAMAISGAWQGTVTQTSTSFSFQTDLVQNQTRLQGVATTARNAASGTMRLNGFVIGPYVVLQETELLTSTGSSAWCLKTMEMTRTGSAPVTLEGTWSAVGCMPGTISMQQ